MVETVAEVVLQLQQQCSMSHATFQDTLCDIFNVSNEYKISWCYPGDKSTETVTYQWPLVQHYTPGPGGDIGDRIYHGYIGYMYTQIHGIGIHKHKGYMYCECAGGLADIIPMTSSRIITQESSLRIIIVNEHITTSHSIIRYHARLFFIFLSFIVESISFNSYLFLLNCTQNAN